MAQYEPGSQNQRINDSAQHLASHLHEVPVHVIPLLADRRGEGIPSWRQASRCGAHLPAVRPPAEGFIMCDEWS